jgi:DNA-binding CsgD family transcriptional regulator
MSSTERPRGPESRPTGPRGQSAAARRTAADRSRLRLSEAAVANEVIEFQLARQRRGLDLDAPIEPLTAREREVIRLVAAGWSDGEIAEQLFISRKTASVHVANIKGKLGAASRVEIAMLAARMGLDDEGVAPPSTSTPQHGSRRPPMCPFKGLASFETADAAFFFGRERVVGETVARLVGSTFLALVGPSGSGKSSILKAGLVPAISAGILPDSDHWTITVARPGSTPARALHQALSAALPRATEGTPPDSGIEGLLARLPMRSRLLLIVDQFEELFSVCEDENERAEAIRSLVGLAGDARSRAVVVLAMRADFYGRCASYRELAELLAANHVLVGPMASDELARAIDLPSRAAGLRIEPELTAAMASDVLDEPGGLPLLSTTLLELWQRREGRTIRLATYERIGGVRGAVARLAESVYTRLPEEKQAVAKSILLRLSAPGGGQFVSRPVPLRELREHRDPTVGEVLDTLTDARLVTVAEGVVEVAHEALLTEWPRLRDWLLEDAEGRRTWDHLARAAREWDRAGKDPGELYRGARLAGALDWATGHERDLNDVEHAFLAESRAALERETDRQRGINRRLRGLLTGAVVLLVAAIGAGVSPLSSSTGRSGKERPPEPPSSSSDHASSPPRRSQSWTRTRS